MKLLDERLPIEHITVMVAEKRRRTAFPPRPAPARRALSTYAVHYYAAPPHAVYRTAGQLLSPPKVTSAVIQLRLHEAPPVTPRSAGSDVPCHPRRVQPAAQDGGQRGQRGAASAQGGGGRGAGCGRRAAHGLGLSS